MVLREGLASLAGDSRPSCQEPTPRLFFVRTFFGPCGRVMSLRSWGDTRLDRVDGGVLRERVVGELSRVRDCFCSLVVTKLKGFVCE